MLCGKAASRSNGLGFVWDPHSAKWESGYTAFVEYKEAYGDVLVPYKYKTADGFNLGSWVSRQLGNKEKMPAESLKRLDDLDFFCHIF